MIFDVLGAANDSSASSARLQLIDNVSQLLARSLPPRHDIIVPTTSLARARRSSSGDATRPATPVSSSDTSSSAAVASTSRAVVTRRSSPVPTSALCECGCSAPSQPSAVIAVLLRSDVGAHVAQRVVSSDAPHRWASLELLARLSRSCGDRRVLRALLATDSTGASSPVLPDLMSASVSSSSSSTTSCAPPPFSALASVLRSAMHSQTTDANILSTLTW